MHGNFLWDLSAKMRRQLKKMNGLFPSRDVCWLFIVNELNNIRFLCLYDASSHYIHSCLMLSAGRLSTMQHVRILRFHYPVVSAVYIAVSFPVYLSSSTTDPVAVLTSVPTPVGTSVGGYLTEPAPGS